MRRRRWLVLAPIALVVAVAVVMVGGALTGPVSLSDKARRIRPGMTRAEVEAVVGEPPGDYCQYAIWDTRPGIDRLGDPLPMQWARDDGLLTVWFSRDDDTATQIRFAPGPDAPPPPFWDRVGARLPW